MLTSDTLKEYSPVGDDIDEYCTIAHDVTDDRKKRTADISIDEGIKLECDSESKSLRFSDLQIAPKLLKGLQSAGFFNLSPVQQRAIPLALMGIDLIVQAKSGTGKTVVFSVAILQSIDTTQSTVQALIISPTREIALQSQKVISRLGANYKELSCQLFVGGFPLADDLRRLTGCHVAVGTPGRLRQLIESAYLSVDHIRVFVLDEADLLLTGGQDAGLTGGNVNNAFPDDVNAIWWALPSSKQMLALSATYTDYMTKHYLRRYMNKPLLVQVLSSPDTALLGIRQFFTIVKSSNRTHVGIFEAKMNVLCHVLDSVNFQQCLIFSNNHNSAHDICTVLRNRDWPVTYISSNLDQEERFRAYNKLRTFNCRVLVSTDLSSRGIDAENVNLVVHMDVPWEIESYMHRMGRAGRYGSYGSSLLIVSNASEEIRLLRRLEKQCVTKIHELPDPIPVNLTDSDYVIDTDTLNNMPVNTVREARKPRRKVKKQSSSSSPISPSKASSVLAKSRSDHEVFGSTIERLSNYIDKFMQNLQPNATMASDNIDDDEYKVIQDVSNVIASDHSPRLTTPNTSPLLDESGQVPATIKSAADQQHAGWSDEQVDTWYEYWRLTEWAVYFYACWVQSLTEYEQCLTKLEELVRIEK